ncbi:hypothetical protein [Variovorax rhizosphaerae]|uniref:Uncharacterized protein n=1 Tax=Variovorax rhizosphaerae TaxID=1836200 RepID=A0ABU8WTF9_9BURK
MARYPYMFLGNMTRMEPSRGWLPLIAQACEEIDRVLGDDRRGFRWTRIVDVVGVLHLHYMMRSASQEWVEVGTPEKPLRVLVDRDPVEPEAQAVRRIVIRAQLASTTTCFVCGEPGIVWPPKAQISMEFAMCAAHCPTTLGGDNPDPDWYYSNWAISEKFQGEDV